MSGPGRLHDLFVTHEAMSPGDYKTRGAGLTIRYGYHLSPFGVALIMVTDRGLAGLSFNDAGRGARGLRRHVRALAERDLSSRTCRRPHLMPRASSIPPAGAPTSRLRVVMIGTDFQVRVWEALLRIPMGRACTYSSIAAGIGAPTASRAVGAAIGANPVSFVVPCHRAHRQIRRADRLSLGPDPQTRHSGMGSGTAFRLIEHPSGKPPQQRLASRKHREAF